MLGCSWGRMKQRIKFMIPASIIRYRGPTAGNKIALTFDDGPNEEYTNHILSMLKEYKFTATFFLIGKEVEKNPELCRTILKQGCEIGNHTYSHRSCSKMSIKEIKEELVQTDEIIKSTTGLEPQLFRPPYGDISYGLLWYLYMIRKDGPSMWSFDIKDERKKNRNRIIQEFNNNNLSPGEIILLHEIRETVHALPRVLDLLSKHNYICTSLSEMAS